MTTARTIAELRYDGPYPPDVIDRLRYGSATNAEIARTEDSIAFFRDQILRMRRSAKKWRARGNMQMVGLNMLDSRFYLREWRKLRRHLNDLRGTNAALKGAKQFFDTLYPKEPDDG